MKKLFWVKLLKSLKNPRILVSTGHIIIPSQVIGDLTFIFLFLLQFLSWESILDFKLLSVFTSS